MLGLAGVVAHPRQVVDEHAHLHDHQQEQVVEGEPVVGDVEYYVHQVLHDDRQGEASHTLGIVHECCVVIEALVGDGIGHEALVVWLPVDWLPIVHGVVDYHRLVLHGLWVVVGRRGVLG